jgi:hypothetical protein
MGSSNSYSTRARSVLKLTLYPESYDWEFLPVPGQTFTDSGTRVCHQPGGHQAGGNQNTSETCKPAPCP